MIKTRAPICVLLALWLATPVLADWDESMPAKWIQEPDLNVTGIDVNCSNLPQDYILADDFECTETGLITGVHIWGSWYQDLLPWGEVPEAVTFTLSLHADIPASENPDGYSMPGETLWLHTFQPGSYVAREWAVGILEGWMNPPEDYVFPGDTVCWQYNFPIPADIAFEQLGTPQEPIVYWLDVKAVVEDETAWFGWKTSIDHWNDDAVWGVGAEPYPGPWYELVYPPQHELAGQSIDLAFVIEGEIQEEQLDYGDAPDAAGAMTYPTLLANDGARHLLDGVTYLGAGVDAETDGQPTTTADGDDLDGNDDEDGVVFTSALMQGGTATIDVKPSIDGFLDAWFDWNADGDWDDAGEAVFAALPVVAPLTSLNVSVPATAAGGQTFARFRFSSTGGLATTGYASDGEVEDYVVTIEDRFTLKWLQRPDLDVTGIDIAACVSPSGEDYLLADDFLCTTTGPVTDFRIWGSWMQDYLPYEADPSAVRFVLSLHADIPAGVVEEYSMPGEVLWWHEFAPGEFKVEPYAQGIVEGFMYPPADYSFPADWTCWLYEFHVDPHFAFRQEGTEEQPIVYWLDLKAFPEDPEAHFGWKTSVDHWNDDAVWGLGAEPYPGPWYELAYPPQHELYGQSLDLAFAILEDPVTAVDDPEVPERFGLRQNVPNPFNPLTEIRYAAPAEGGRLRLDVYDAMGRRVRVLIDGEVTGGEHVAVWDGRNDAGEALSTGVYFARLYAEGVHRTVKMVLLK